MKFARLRGDVVLGHGLECPQASACDSELILIQCVKSNEPFGWLQSDVALKAAQEAGVFSALFAPSWVYETKAATQFQKLPYTGFSDMNAL